MLNATDGILEQGSVDAHVLSKAYLVKLGRCRTQSFITELTSDDLQKLHAALCIPHVSTPFPLREHASGYLGGPPQ